MKGTSKYLIILFSWLSCSFAYAQEPTDCENTLIVCGNSEINLNVNGRGRQELSGTNTCGSQENNSLWLRVTLETGGTLGFTLTPGSTAITEDYDFFVFGPNVSCGSLGQAIRCSTTNPQAAGQGNNLTGMNGSETEVSEGPGPDGNSFVSWLDVVAGETYFIVIDRPVGNSAFSLEWTGSATFPSPPVNSVENDTSVLNLESCDVTSPFDDGFTTFDLEANTSLLVGTQTNIQVSYHETESDANINVDAITGLYTNTSATQIIYARLTNSITGCFDTTQFVLNVNLGPDFGEPDNLEECDDSNDGDSSNGRAVFSLRERNDQILNGQDPNDINISFHTSLNNAETDAIPLPLFYSNTVANSQTIFVRVESVANVNCFSTTTFDLIVNPVPNVFNANLLQCDEDANPNDGLTIFNLDEATLNLTGASPNRSVKFYANLADAQSSNNEVNSTSFFNWQNPQIVYAQVINDMTDCFNISELTLNVSSTGSNDAVLTACDDEAAEAGFFEFNLNDADAIVVAGLPAGLTISYYELYEDALIEQNQLNPIFTNTEAYSQVIYARVENMSDCYGISEVELKVNELPDIETELELFYCLNLFPQTITLDGGIVIDNPNNYTYLWSTSETTSEIQVNIAGNYSVEVTNRNTGCSIIRTINVEPSNIATIESIDIIDGTETNSVTINVSGEGTYEYALFNEYGMYTPFQTENSFNNIDPDIYTVRIRDIKNNCGVIENIISVIGFPQFFTPNNDGYNDTWVVKGISSQFQPQSKILIFDRFGKLVKQLDPTGLGWDGTFNGNPLPVSDYWFSVTLQDGRTFMNHFTLKR